MSESREITLASAVKGNGENRTPGHAQRMAYFDKDQNGIVYFSIGPHHKFCTFGTHVWNEHNPLYGSKVIEVMAAHRDTETKEEQITFNENFNRFQENRGKLFERLFMNALKVLHTAGESAFLGYVESFLDITENQDNCQSLLKEIEKAK